MTSKQFSLVAALGFACLSNPAFAEFKGVAHFGYEFGGENILETDLVYIQDGSRPSIKAGNGLVLAGGVAYNFTPDLAVQTTLGFKYQAAKKASNGSADFTRFPVEALALYTVEKIRLGAGITHHLSPKLTGTGLMSDYDQAFEDATGVVFQADYVTESGLMFGIRRTDLTYTTKDTGYDVDGSSFGIHMTGAF